MIYVDGRKWKKATEVKEWEKMSTIFVKSVPPKISNYFDKNFFEPTKNMSR